MTVIKDGVEIMIIFSGIRRMINKGAHPSKILIVIILIY